MCLQIMTLTPTAMMIEAVYNGASLGDKIFMVHVNFIAQKNYIQKVWHVA